MSNMSIVTHPNWTSPESTLRDFLALSFKTTFGLLNCWHKKQLHMHMNIKLLWYAWCCCRQYNLK